MATREHYSHKIADEKKRRKDKEAEQRRLLRASRSVAQQLQVLDAGQHVAAKERARLRDVK